MLEESYEKMLERAYSQLPPSTKKRERFEIIQPITQISGNRTILFNLKELSDQLGRDAKKILKFLSGELATSGAIEGAQAIFQGKFSRETFERLIERFTKEYVYCPVCHQPDTKIVRSDRLYFIVCDACGARSSIRKL